MLIKKLTQELLQKLYSEVNANENKAKIQKNILDPLVNYIYPKTIHTIFNYNCIISYYNIFVYN